MLKQKRMNNLSNIIIPHIKILKSKGLYLEVFYMYISTIEFMLQNCIFDQNEWISNILNKNKIKFVRENNLDEKTLGQLIKIFTEYFNDEKLIDQLNGINSFRKKIIHHILDFSIEELNQEAKSKENLYKSIISKLIKHNIIIINKQTNSLKRQVVKKNLHLKKLIRKMRRQQNGLIKKRSLTMNHTLKISSQRS